MMFSKILDYIEETICVVCTIVMTCITFANVVTRSSGDSRVVILMHDSATKAETVKALPKIIEHYRSKGYSFGSLQNSTYPITFGYRS